MNFGGIDESFDFDNFRALDFNLFEVLWRDNDVLFRLELVALDDFLTGERFAAFLAFLLVTNRAVILLVQLVKTNGLFGIDGVVNPDRNRNQRKPNMALPNGSHNSPRLDKGPIVENGGLRTLMLKAIIAFIALDTEHETCRL